MGFICVFGISEASEKIPGSLEEGFARDRIPAGLGDGHEGKRKDCLGAP